MLAEKKQKGKKRKEKAMRKRIFAAFVCLCMLMALVPSMAYAGDTVSVGGLCEHHTQHDDACGYSEGTAEVPCSHEHTEECYTQATKCVHKHTAECYSDGILPAEGEEKTADSCSHQCSEESGCITKELNCNHEHDGSCGYVPATAGTPCTYDCQICNAPAAEEAECICETKCTEEKVNADCPVCGSESGDIFACVGKILEVPTLLGDFRSSVLYLDENGNTQTCSAYTSVTDRDTEWQTGWYVVDSDIKISSRVAVKGDVRVILADGCTLAVNSGIRVEDGNSFTVYAQSVDKDIMGKLIATGGYSESGIGGDLFGTCGEIVINGGWIKARGDFGGAGIGSGDEGENGGNIIINGGNVFAYGDAGGAGIGASDNCEGSGIITINGGTVWAEGGDYAAGIGAGDDSAGVDVFINGGNITAKSKSSGAGIGGGYGNEECTITITDGIIDATAGKNAAGIGSASSGAGCTIIISGGTITAKGGEFGAGIGGGYKGESKEITIIDGNITATGGEFGAGIGGGYYKNGGAITIQGGTIKAYGSEKAAGIGGGYYAYSSTNTSIYDGDIIAIGGVNGAGIGGGQYGTGNKINIYGGTIIAKSGKDGEGNGAGIGGGGNGDKAAGGKGGTTVISGGTITAMGYVGIGGGKENLDNGVQKISPAANLVILVKAGADESSAVELVGSPFTEETIVTDLIAGTKYFYCKTDKNVIVTEGDPAVFEVTADGIENPKYQWQQSVDNGNTWTDIVGANLAIYTAEATKIEMNGYQYRCIITGDSGSVTSNVFLLIVNVAVDNIKLNKTATVMNVGDTETLTVTVEPANATNKTVTWSSSNPSVATVDQSGKVTAVGKGTATITAASIDGSGKTATCTVTVKKKSSGGSVFFWDLKFDTNGGSDIDTVTEWEYSTIDLDEYVPEKEGYKFVGWYADEDLTKEIDEVYLTQDTTVYAKWEKIEEEVPEEPEEVEETEETETISFKDVKENDWFYEAVSYAVENGLMSGMSEDIFAPNTPLTREMLAVVLYNVEGQPESAGVNPFTDVKADIWYTDAILWANENGIVAGYDNGAYGVGDFITREQFAAILYRYAQFKGYDTTQGGMAVREFSDYENISDYARPAMAWAVNAGIMGGMDDGTLMPQGKATRAEAATMLMNFCENMVEK